MTVYLSPHFTLGEFETDAVIPDAYMENARNLAMLLDAMRAAGGGKCMVITSGYRPAEVNAAVGGVGGSQHLTASAVDVRRIGTDSSDWVRAVVASSVGPWGQILVYPYTDGHLHISLPGGHTNFVGVEVGKHADGSSKFSTWDGVGEMPPWGGGSVTLPDAPATEGGAYVSTTGAIVVIGLFLLILLFTMRG